MVAPDSMTSRGHAIDLLYRFYHAITLKDQKDVGLIRHKKLKERVDSPGSKQKCSDRETSRAFRLNQSEVFNTGKS